MFEVKAKVVDKLKVKAGVKLKSKMKTKIKLKPLILLVYTLTQLSFKAT